MNQYSDRDRRWLVALADLGGCGRWNEIRKRAGLRRIAHSDDAAIKAHQDGLIEPVGSGARLTRRGRTYAALWRRGVTTSDA